MREVIADFCRVVEQQFDIYQDLYNVLTHERDALVAQDSSRISACIADKEERLIQISDLTNRRQECLAYLSRVFDVPEEKILFSFLIEHIADEFADRLFALQGKYKTIVVEIADLNYKNALLTEKLFNRNEGLMNAYRSSANNKAGLYGNNGRKAATVSRAYSGVVC